MSSGAGAALAMLCYAMPDFRSVVSLELLSPPDAFIIIISFYEASSSSLAPLGAGISRAVLMKTIDTQRRLRRQTQAQEQEIMSERSARAAQDEDVRSTAVFNFTCH